MEEKEDTEQTEIMEQQPQRRLPVCGTADERSHQRPNKPIPIFGTAFSRLPHE
jgi:hypothetical protein